jgi:hypothetical protein
MWCGDTLAEHITRTIRTLVGYCKRLTPARSAAAYTHQVHKKHTILGSKSVVMNSPLVSSAYPSPVRHAMISATDARGWPRIKTQVLLSVAGLHPSPSVFIRVNPRPNDLHGHGLDLRQQLLGFETLELHTLRRTGGGAVAATFAENGVHLANLHLRKIIDGPKRAHF